MVRFRTLGCYPLTGAIESDAASLEEIVGEMLTARTSERQGRLIDQRRGRLDGKEEARRVFLIVQHIRANEITGSDGIRDYLAVQEKKSLLRFLTCGSVDDGKSTLIGRLLYDTKLIFEDQLAALERDSRKHGTNGDDIDFALLVDGLEAEREQGITIDVAYRFFATPKRKFIVADTPGHEQYTRNMATGASTADRRGRADRRAAGRAGADPPAFDHRLAARHPPCRAGRQQDRSGRLRPGRSSSASSRDYRGVRRQPRLRLDHADPDVGALRRQCHQALGADALVCRPDAARASGDDRRRRRSRRERAVPLPGAVCEPSRTSISAALPAPSPPARSAPGDEVVVAKSGKASRVKRIVTHGGDLARAVEGQAVTLVLEDEVEVSRGNMLVSPTARPSVADQFAANIVWFDEHALLPGRSYILRTETDQASATVTRPQAPHRRQQLRA